MAKKKTPGAAGNSEPAKAADKLLDALTAELLGCRYGTNIDDIASGKAILAQNRETQAAIVRLTLNQLSGMEKELNAIQSKLESEDTLESRRNWSAASEHRHVFLLTLRTLLRRTLPLREEEVIDLLRWPPSGSREVNDYFYPLLGTAKAVENFAASNEMSNPLQEAMQALIAKLRENESDKDCRKVAGQLQSHVSGGPQIRIEPGEAWSDAALAGLQKMKAKASKAWNALLLHCQTGGAGKLTPRWRKEAEPLVAAVGFSDQKENLLRWFPLVDKPRTKPIKGKPYFDEMIQAPHVELLRGLVWCCAFQEDADLGRALTRLAISAYRKIPGQGPRLVSLGNACVTALGMMPGRAPIGQLAVLKVKVKFGTAQREIDKAFNASAEREGLPRDEIEELAVPAYGLEEVGRRRETFGSYQAHLIVDGSSARLQWSKEGKPIKSVPAAAKTEQPEEFKELQAAVKDINAMLPAQRERLDGLFLAQKTWPLALWRERYLDHPLIGTIARRLIWSFPGKKKTLAGIWHDGQLVGANDKPLDLPDDTTAALWHPIDRGMDEILGWRDWLMRHEVVQPFKQAHREVYLLTDAERRTGTYSNRFAAHVLRQHQFNALCAARGWKNKLRLMVDDSYPPAHRLLPSWNLRAEYWIEGAGTEYGQDTNDSGTFLYLTTDQVRFYRTDAAQLHAHAGGGGYGGWNQTEDEPLPLETIPPLVFSEIMRDVDLFVGVASVGNDPNWADGGPRGQYRDYWQSYSFGELSATAQTRRVLLERLIPRLKIAPRCTLAERFLIVRGELRTYKIHLGSGNILMLPNDQYLCIVPKQTTAGQDRVFLPFEGDGTLAVILSKAFLLADDTKITDPTIISQLRKK